MAQCPISQIVQSELRSFLKNPEAYLQNLEKAVNAIVCYPRRATKWFRKLASSYEELQDDTELRHTLRELKQDARNTICILGQYVVLADFRNIADEEREEEIQAEISEQLNDDENDKALRDRFRLLANFLERIVNRLDNLRSLSRDITARVEHIKKKSHDYTCKSEEKARKMRLLKVGVFALTVTLGFATGGAGFFALGAGSILALGAGATGGGVAGVAGAKSYRRHGQREAKFWEVAKSFDDLHKVAVKIDGVATSAESKWKLCDVDGEVNACTTISAINLSKLPKALARLFDILRSVDLEEEKNDLNGLTRSLRGV